MAETKVTSAEIVTASASGIKNTNLSTVAGELGGSWTSWTPTWTNLTVGNGTVHAAYTQIGKTVHARYSIVFGTTSSVAGALSFTLPVTSVTYGQTQPIGTAFFNNIAVESYHGFVGWASTTTANLQGPNGLSDTRTTTATTNKPIAAYATSDQISFTITYEAA